MKSLEDDSIISNIIQGQLWKDLTTDDLYETTLPIIINFDDYETNNLIGSHKGISKSSAFYAIIPCLLSRLTSKLYNIFLFVLFNTLYNRILPNYTKQKK